MKTAICIACVALLAGCSHSLQPQSFAPAGYDLKKAPVVVNNYRADGFNYFIKNVDGKRLGDLTYGTMGISEFYVEPGVHTLEIVANFMADSLWANAYQTTFVGNIKCDFREGYAYTVAPSPNGSPVGKSWLNNLPLIKAGQLLAGDKIVDVNGALKLACVEHDVKPENKLLGEMVDKHGWKLSNELFNPNAK